MRLTEREKDSFYEQEGGKNGNKEHALIDGED